MATSAPLRAERYAALQQVLGIPPEQFAADWQRKNHQPMKVLADEIAAHYPRLGITARDLKSWSHLTLTEITCRHCQQPFQPRGVSTVVCKAPDCQAKEKERRRVWKEAMDSQAKGEVTVVIPGSDPPPLVFSEDLIP